MSELTCLELAVGLWFVHLFCQMGLAGRAFSTAYLFSSRDAQLPPNGLVWGRATRAFANYVENLVAFAALDLGLIVTQHTAGWAPTGLDRRTRALSPALPVQRHLPADGGRRRRDDQPAGDVVKFGRGLIAAVFQARAC